MLNSALIKARRKIQSDRRKDVAKGIMMGLSPEYLAEKYHVKKLTIYSDIKAIKKEYALEYVQDNPMECIASLTENQQKRVRELWGIIQKAKIS